MGCSEFAPKFNWIELSQPAPFQMGKIFPIFVTISLITILSRVLTITNFIWWNQFLSFSRRRWKKHLTPFSFKKEIIIPCFIFSRSNLNLRCKFHSNGAKLWSNSESEYDFSAPDILTFSYWGFVPGNFISFFRCIFCWCECAMNVKCCGAQHQAWYENQEICSIALHLDESGSGLLYGLRFTVVMLDIETQHTHTHTNPEPYEMLVFIFYGRFHPFYTMQSLQDCGKM